MTQTTRDAQQTNAKGFKWKTQKKVDGRIILKLILKGLGGRGLDSCSPGYEPVESIYEHANETSGSSRCGKFLDYLSVY